MSCRQGSLASASEPRRAPSSWAPSEELVAERGLGRLMLGPLRWQGKGPAPVARGGSCEISTESGCALRGSDETPKEAEGTKRHAISDSPRPARALG